MKKVHEEKIEMILDAFEIIKHSNSDSRYIGVSLPYRSFKDRLNGKVKFAVNWASYRTDSIDDVLEFAENLKKTAQLVETINSMELEQDFSDERPFASEEEYKLACKEVYDMCFNFETGKLIAWMLS